MGSGAAGSGSSSGSGSGSGGPVSLAASGGGRIVASVELPGGSREASGADALRVASLQRQLEQVKALSDERAAALQRERATLTDAGEKRAAADAASIAGLQREVEELQAKLTHLTRGARTS